MSSSAPAATAAAVWPFRFGDARDWFAERRFGLFVHWGLYAVGGVHEQEVWRYGVGVEPYRRYVERFNPAAFDPDRWLDLAEAVGMGYLVFTAKHHDGFAMWNTRETAFSVMATPYGRDVVAELARACHARAFPLSLYYSVVDWHHPNYPNLGRHHEIVTPPERHDWDAYLAFLKRQVRELCTGYGDLHGLWWDMNVGGARDPSVNAMVRALQPAAVVNDRGLDPGDFGTPERAFDGADETAPFARRTEGCDSVGVNSWGYRREEDYYTVRHLQHQIASHLARGGNFLLNVGPDADGVVPDEAERILRRLGAWYRAVGPALAARPRPELAGGDDGLLATGDGRVVNVVLTRPPASSTLALAAFDTLPAAVELLNTGERLAATLEPTAYELGTPPCLRLRHLPADRLGDTIPVVRLTFDAPPVPRRTPRPTAPHAGPML